MSAKPLPTLACSTSLLALATAATLGGCIGHPIKPVEFDGSSVKGNVLPLDVNRKVDLLIILDNSGSMGDEQANLAANFAPIIEGLEGVGADYRIGITTTDLGGQNCSGGAGGELHLSSCLDRPQTFVFNGNNQFDVACEAQCGLTGAELTILPTSLGSTDEAMARPWIQGRNGVNNLPEGVDTLEAFQCFAPQGISGCGWESPLEAMARVIEHANDPGRPEYGFLRDDALLGVLVVTDEVDCSFQADSAAALFESGTFFADGVEYATSAVCWNAGVACTGDSPYDDCRPVDFDGDGVETSNTTDAVLHPVTRYTDMLQAIADDKLEGREVLVSVLAGVPLDYHHGEVDIEYADSADVEFQQSFGIGEGCSNVVNGALQTAVPPVRLREFAEAMSVGGINMYSVCDDDYTPAFDEIISGVIEELPPACFGECALDLDQSTAELDYSCTVFEEVGDDRTILPECLEDGSIPDDADACWIAKTGAELSPACAVPGQNLEFELLRRDGVEIAADSAVSAACELSPGALDCD